MALKPHRHALGNGVTILVNENATTPAVSVLVSVAGGGYRDAPGCEGTAALVARVLDRGTRSRSADAIADELDRRGVSLSVSASRHAITVATTCLADDLDAVLAIAADLVQSPVFPEDEVRTKRTALLTSIRQDDDDPGSVAETRLRAELYGAHPYGRRVRGTAETVTALTRDHLTAFHRDHVLPAQAVVAIVGSVTTSAIVDRVAVLLDGWAARSDNTGMIEDVPDAVPPAARMRADVAMPEKAQADIAYGFVGPRRTDADYIAASVMNNVLGQYALGGRLGDSIRERQGMAYYVHSSLDAAPGPGPLMIRAGVAAANVDRAIASIDAEVEAVRGDGLTAQEVDQSKRYMVGALPRQLETNAGIAAFLLNAEIFGLGLEYDRRLPDLIRAVTWDDAVGAARRWLDTSRATIVVAGPPR
jgi:zinc protease